MQEPQLGFKTPSGYPDSGYHAGNDLGFKEIVQYGKCLSSSSTFCDMWDPQPRLSTASNIQDVMSELTLAWSEGLIKVHFPRTKLKTENSRFVSILLG